MLWSCVLAVILCAGGVFAERSPNCTQSTACDSLCLSDFAISYSKRDQFPICIEILSKDNRGNNTAHGRMVLMPQVDIFSRMNLQWQSVADPVDYGFSPEVKNRTGFLKAYSTGYVTDENNNVFDIHTMLSSPESPLFHDVAAARPLVVGFYTLLVHLSLGRPTKLTWEIGKCNGCSRSSCVLGQECGIEAKDCSGVLCQPRIFIAFTGTDSRGHILTSSGSMLTRFSSFGLGNIFNDIKDKI